MFCFGLGLQLGAGLVVFVVAVAGGIVQAVLPGVVAASVLAVVAVVVLLREAGLVRLPVPENARLVPETVRLRGRVRGPLQFGFEMGTGMRTYSPSALPHLVLLAVLLVMPLPGALAAGAGFAAARWLMPVISNAHSADGSWGRIWMAHHRAIALATALGTVAALAAGVGA